MKKPVTPSGIDPGTVRLVAQRLSHYATGRNMPMKNPVTPPGIDPGTVRLAAQRLNHYATPSPKRQKVLGLIQGKGPRKFASDLFRLSAFSSPEIHSTFRVVTNIKSMADSPTFHPSESS